MMCFAKNKNLCFVRKNKIRIREITCTFYYEFEYQGAYVIKITQNYEISISNFNIAKIK